ncbi:hypothetical protein NFI96_032622, partial [Prochilodus magdalenae]
CIKLACLVKNQRLYRECSLFCFTETWLTTDTPDANVELPGFSTVRADRDPTLSGKRKVLWTVPPGKNRTIDLLYANVRDAYRATPLPPLGKSDHTLVFLQPQYKTTGIVAAHYHTLIQSFGLLKQKKPSRTAMIPLIGACCAAAPTRRGH